MTEQGILIIDNEPWNVAALRLAFKTRRVPYDFTERLEEAIEYVLEAQDAGTPYSIVICDNHLGKTPYEGYVPEFGGIDFSNALIGKYPSPGHQLFARDVFGVHREAIAENYSGRVILFSGNALENSIDNPHLFNGVIPIQKRLEGKGKCCERDVLRAMEHLGYPLSIGDDELISLKNGGRSMRSHEKYVRKFLEKQILPPGELASLLLDFD